jgi:hypothetical protein
MTQGDCLQGQGQVHDENTADITVHNLCSLSSQLEILHAQSQNPCGKASWQTPLNMYLGLL